MSENRLFAPIARFQDLVASILHPIAPLLTRIVVGQAYMQTGHAKWTNIDKFTAFFDSLGIPAPHANALFIATLELVGGALLILGLGTRVLAILLSATMVVALMTADRDSFLAAFALNPEHGMLDVTPVPFLLFLLWLIAFGAGPISIDSVLRRKSGTSA